MFERFGASAPFDRSLTAPDRPCQDLAPQQPHMPPLPVCVFDNPWFAKLDAAHQKALCDNLDRVTLVDQQPLVTNGMRVGRRQTGFTVLLSGSLKVSSINAAGREAILSLVHPGQWFGELSLLDRQPANRDICSLGDSQVGLVPAQVFDDLMQHPAFAKHVNDLVCARTRMLMSLLEDFSLRSARARSARRLLLLAHGDDLRHGQTHHELKVSHDALAAMLGMTRQTLSTQLSALSKVGAIAQGYGRILIVSMVVLMAEASLI